MGLTSSDIRRSTTLFELRRGKFMTHASLFALLPDVETALFFAKAYDLDYIKLSELLSIRFRTVATEELFEGDHSLALQDYLVDVLPPNVSQMYPEMGFVPDVPHADILPEVWASLEVDVAKSIKEVADKLVDVLDRLPGKNGQMTFSHMLRLNKQRGTIGQFAARVSHPPHYPNLVILDVSGSMTQATIKAIVGEAVALAYKADAHLATVSNTAFHWEPGTYDVNQVLAVAEYGGTQYETLAPLLCRHWGTVVTIADYDSSPSAKEFIAKHATGSAGVVLDISLVDRPTFLSECVGQLAQEVRPLLIGNSRHPL